MSLKNPFILKAKRALYADFKHGDAIIAEFHTTGFGLGGGINVPTEWRGIFLGDDGFNLLMTMNGKVVARVPLLWLDAVRPAQ
jgi:hypothetical protein